MTCASVSQLSKRYLLLELQPATRRLNTYPIKSYVPNNIKTEDCWNFTFQARLWRSTVQTFVDAGRQTTKTTMLRTRNIKADSNFWARVKRFLSKSRQRITNLFSPYIGALHEEKSRRKLKRGRPRKSAGYITSW